MLRDPGAARRRRHPIALFPELLSVTIDPLPVSPDDASTVTPHAETPAADAPESDTASAPNESASETTGAPTARAEPTEPSAEASPADSSAAPVPSTQAAASPGTSDSAPATGDPAAPQIPATGAVNPPAAQPQAATPPAATPPAAVRGGAAFDTLDAAANRVDSSGSGGTPSLRDGAPGLGGGAGNGEGGPARGGVADGTPTGPIGADGPRELGTPATEVTNTPQLATAPPQPLLLQLFPLAIEENVKGGAVATVVVRNAGNRPLVFEVDDPRFHVVDGELRLKKDIALDYETEPSLDLALTVTTPNGTALSATVTIAVTDVNEAPTAIDIDDQHVAGLVGGAVVGKLTTIDPDHHDSHTYTIDDPRFEIVDGDTLKLKDWAALDPAAETDGQVTVTVTTTDSGGLSFQQQLTLTIDAPQGTSGGFGPLGSESFVGDIAVGEQALRSGASGGNAVAPLAEGAGFVVTWLATDDQSAESTVFARRFDANGQPREAALEVATFHGTGQAPIVAALADGGFIVHWVQQSGNDHQVFAQRFDDSGSPAGQVAATGAILAGATSSIASAGLANGDFVLVWQEESTSFVGQRFNTSGEPQGDAFTISSYSYWHGIQSIDVIGLRARPKSC